MNKGLYGMAYLIPGMIFELEKIGLVTSGTEAFAIQEGLAVAAPPASLAVHAWSEPTLRTWRIMRSSGV